jgi:broad specificity phosphatase PhoE
MAESLPSDPADPFWDAIHPGMSGAKQHTAVFVRHGESESNKHLMDGSPRPGGDRDAPLTELGQTQATLTRALFTPTCYFESSPQKRAIDTIPGGVVLHDLREYNRGAPFETKHGTVPSETEGEFEERVRGVLDRLRAITDRRRTVIATHSLFISKAIQLLYESKAPTFVHLGNASITVVDFTLAPDGTTMAEIQMIGGVHHLPPHLRTGHHTNLYSAPFTL